MLNKRFWEHRYEHEQTGWDLGVVSPPLKAFIDHLSSKKLEILIPGSGNGYEAEYLLANGFEHVTVLDIAEMPLQNLKNRLGDPKGLNLICGDFFEHTGQYDLILEQTFFCALDPAKRMDYVKHMHVLLKPGGHLAGVLFNVEFEKEGPPFGGEEAEYRVLLKPYFKILKMDLCENSIQPRMNTELFFVAESKTLN